MRLVGLISGGKDSVYNMLQCITAGHEIVAVANIEPETSDELDSYMYQTVGHEVITLIAGALCLPLYRYKTKGKAVTHSKEYVRTTHDEVEDLLELLTNVKKVIKIDGVAVGAIASDYQRTRVENVCTRLGLKCFAYLWKRNQIELLEEMIDAEVDAVIVKVACIGLNATHLGMSIKDIQPHLLELHKKYGVNVCGEGGEYETITLDCPLYQRSITITESEKVILRKDEFAPVCILKVKKATLDAKSWETVSVGSLEGRTNFIQANIKGPLDFMRDCVDECSEAIFPQRYDLTIQDLPCPFETDDDDAAGNPAFLREYWKEAGLSKSVSALRLPSSKYDTGVDTSHGNLNFSSGWCCVGNVTAPTINAALLCAEGHLKRMDYEWQEVVFVNLYVKNMDDFAKINAAYSLHMPEGNPPARACVETLLPADVGVILSVIAYKNVSKSKRVVASSKLEREALRVQSISHWAPANIGPYSQCIMVSKIYFVSGQIPLIPGLMEILNKPIFHQCRLSLRHVLRVLQAMDSRLHFSNILHAICYVTAEIFAPDILSLWSYITKVDTTPVAVVVVTKLPSHAQLEWEVVASGSENPSANEETHVVGNLQLEMKVCVCKENFSSSLVCRIGQSKAQSSRGKKLFAPAALSSALTLCVDVLRRHSKTATPLCMLKIFYRVQSYAIGDVLNEVISTFTESKGEFCFESLLTECRSCRPSEGAFSLDCIPSFCTKKPKKSKL